MHVFSARCFVPLNEIVLVEGKEWYDQVLWIRITNLWKITRFVKTTRLEINSLWLWCLKDVTSPMLCSPSSPVDQEALSKDLSLHLSNNNRSKNHPHVLRNNNNLSEKSCASNIPLLGRLGLSWGRKRRVGHSWLIVPQRSLTLALGVEAELSPCQKRRKKDVKGFVARCCFRVLSALPWLGHICLPTLAVSQTWKRP